MSEPIAVYKDASGDIWERYEDGTGTCVQYSDGENTENTSTRPWDLADVLHGPMTFLYEADEGAEDEKFLRQMVREEVALVFIQLAVALRDTHEDA